MDVSTVASAAGELAPFVNSSGIQAVGCETQCIMSILKSMKFSANVPDDVLAFVDGEVTAGRFPSRSAAITQALVDWRVTRMESSYAEAFSSTDDDLDVLISDGLEQDESL